MSLSVTQRIKEAIDLPELVREYLPLKKFGSRWVAKCPFHKEDTASFGVHAEYFKCFGCGLGGDAITFIEKIEGISTGAAIRLLSKRTGIPLDSRPQSRVARQHDREKTAFTAWWYARNLRALSKRLSWMLVSGDSDEVCDETGAIVQAMRALKPAERRALAAARALETERAAWRASVEFDKWFEEVWLGLAKSYWDQACSNLEYAEQHADAQGSLLLPAS